MKFILGRKTIVALALAAAVGTFAIVTARGSFAADQAATAQPKAATAEKAAAPAMNCGTGACNMSDQAPTAATTATPTDKTVQTNCPIMGGKINKKIFADYQGKRVYFCCAGCPPEFNKDPAKYIKALEDKGIVLEKTPQPEAAAK